MDSSSSSSNRRVVVPVAIGCASIALIILLSWLLLWIYHNRRKRRRMTTTTSKTKNHINMNKKKSVGCIDYKLLETATGNFTDTNKLCESGFVCLYRAHLGENCYAVVKKLEDGVGSEDFEREFKNEVELLSRRIHHHSNIITLLGHCIQNDTRFIVYEMMENGSLETQLHGSSRGSALTWHIRMKIALDIARGLEYLHEHCHPPVIHRDVKSSNILLDSNFNAKLSDFGLALVGSSGGSSSSYTGKNNNIRLSGAFGYVAPEFLLDGKLTDKSDVYAFGVVLLELLLGRKPVEKLSPAQCQSIVTWAMPQLTDRTKLPQIVDPAIQGTMDHKHLYQVAAVAVLCVQPEPSYRPLITDVLHSLVPLVPAHLGGTFRVTTIASTLNSND